MPNIKMIQGDCMEIMKQYPDKYFQLACVDPPYGININMNMGLRAGQKKMHEEKGWDCVAPKPFYFEELMRVSNNQIIWGGNYFRLPITASWIFWDKNVPAGISFADGELAWTSYDKTLRKAFIPYSGYQGSEGKIHPTQKPVALYKWLLSRYAKPGDRILDTHGGSGSIAIACHDLGFDLTWMELDADYYKAACEQYKLHASQAQLFEPEPTKYKQESLL